eukprot:TRINITY_DN3397_c0_g1_i2.p1 TRINITY_DN3397_c0_g1~~TRINITY_DN3397_c0_g1_i2.p1  ORF type:complete len:881 (-),score=135.23 TRINITY_DN3397_c0_g1_i2:1239-3779(-)
MGDKLILCSCKFPMLLVAVVCGGQYDVEANDYCKKILRTVNAAKLPPGLVLLEFYPLLESIVILRDVLAMRRQGAISNHVSRKLINKLKQNCISHKEKTERGSREDWLHRYLFTKAILRQVQWLLTSEYSRKSPEFVDIYKKAIQEGEKQKAYVEVGLAAEILHDFVSLSNPSQGNHYWQTMIKAYVAWGCNLKVSLLDQKHSPVKVSCDRLNSLDAQQVLFSLTSIHRTCSIEDLLYEILKIILTFYGLHKGVFIMDDPKQSVQLMVKMMATESIECTTNVSIPRSVSNWVQENKQILYLDKFSETETNFDQDEYFRQFSPQFMLCVPFGTRGCIYLEEARSDRRFSPDMVAFLKVISQQVELIVEAWNTQHDLAIQVSATNKAKKLESQQAMFIDALCHEMRNPLNGLFGSLYVLQLACTEAKTHSLWNLFYGRFVVAVVLSMLIASYIPKSCVLVLVVCLWYIASKGKSSGAEFEDILRDIQECLDHQKAILDDTLQVKKLESPTYQLYLSSTTVSSVVSSVMAMFSAATKRKGLAFEVTYKIVSEKSFIFRKGQQCFSKILSSESLTEKELKEEPRILVDALKVKQVLINLVSNAVKFTEVGKITLKSKIVVKNSTDAELLFEVEDTGPGFTQETSERIFNYFVQSGSRNYGGSGLGLAISKKIVEYMGGTITVKSVVGKGSTFEVVLPVKRSAKTEASPRSRPQRLLENSETREKEFPMIKHLLVVDDNKLNRKTLTIFARHHAVDCLEASNGVEAIEVFKNHDVDCIVMDIKMPILDGIAATKEIRKIEREMHKHKSFIIGLSGNQSSAEDAMNSGMDDFLVKPTAPFHVLQRFVKFLGT